VDASEEVDVDWDVEEVWASAATAEIANAMTRLKNCRDVFIKL